MPTGTITEQAVFDVVRQTFPALAATDLVDDAVVLPTGQVISTDTLVGERHFSHAYCSPTDIGVKAVRVSISDMAACGAQPTGLLVSLALPNTVDTVWVREFYAGLKYALDEAQCPLLGGDTVASDTLVITTTALGQVAAGSVAGRRFNAKPGHTIAVCGHHGLSAVGLCALQHGIEGVEDAKLAHRQPPALVDDGLSLAAAIAQYAPQPYALTDTSDGLAAALLAIAQASGVACTVQANALPIHPTVATFARQHSSVLPARYTQVGYDDGALALTLWGGEDFGLLATVPAGVTLPPRWLPIGQVAEGTGASLQLPNGQQIAMLPKQLYQHFA